MENWSKSMERYNRKIYHECYKNGLTRKTYMKRNILRDIHRKIYTDK